MPNDLQLGTIVEATKTYDLETVTKRMVIIEEPRSSLWKDSGIWVRLLEKRTKEVEEAWIVQFRDWRIDCMRAKHLIRKEKIQELNLRIVEQLTDEEIDEIFDAEGYAEKQRYFGI